MLTLKENLSYDDLGLRSYNPRVSMDRAVHYTTQQGVYERLAVGVGQKPDSHPVSTKPEHEPKPKPRTERRESKQLMFEINQIVFSL